jgi:uncharacterized protein (DUF736 family)
VEEPQQGGVDYLSVKLDDPTLAGAINCALMASTDDEGFILVWPRDNRKAKAE